MANSNITLDVINRNIEKLYNEVEFIKNMLSEEYELSSWAKKELAEARKSPDSKLISHDEVKRRILQK